MRNLAQDVFDLVFKALDLLVCCLHVVFKAGNQGLLGCWVWLLGLVQGQVRLDFRKNLEVICHNRHTVGPLLFEEGQSGTDGIEDVNIRVVKALILLKTSF